MVSPGLFDDNNDSSPFLLTSIIFNLENEKDNAFMITLLFLNSMIIPRSYKVWHDPLSPGVGSGNETDLGMGLDICVAVSKNSWRCAGSGTS